MLGTVPSSPGFCGGLERETQTAGLEEKAGQRRRPQRAEKELENTFLLGAEEVERVL